MVEGGVYDGKWGHVWQVCADSAAGQGCPAMLKNILLRTVPAADESRYVRVCV